MRRETNRVLFWSANSCALGRRTLAWTAPAADPRRQAPHLRAWLRPPAWRRPALAVILPSEEVILRRFARPIPAEKDLRQVADDALPWPLDQSAWTAWPDGDAGFHLAGVSRSRLDLYKDALAAAGARANGVGMRIAGQTRWLEQPRPRAGNMRTAAAATLLIASVFFLRAGRARTNEAVVPPTPAAARPAAEPGEAVRRLGEISNRLPAGARMTAWIFDAADGAVTIEGRARAYADVSSLVRALDGIEGLHGSRSEKAALSAGSPAVDFRVKADLRRTPRRPPAADPTPVARDGIEARVSEAAKAAAVARLTNVGWTRTAAGARLETRWTGTPRAAALFVSTLESNVAGACLRLELMPDERGGVTGNATFDAERRAAPATAPAGAVAFRQAFLLRQPAPPSDGRRDESERLARQKELERYARESAQRADEQRLADLRRRLETTLTLSGIVNNGRETLAFLDRRSAGGALMVRTGDAVDGARVSRIDDRRGEVLLDCEGKFEVALRLSAAGAPR